MTPTMSHLLVLIVAVMVGAYLVGKFPGINLLGKVLPQFTMRQNSVIFGALLIGFIVYVTIKGRLPSYIALFWSKSKQGILPANGGAFTPSSTSNNPGTLPGMGDIGSYVSTLPAIDQGLWAETRQVLTGYYPSGLPGYGTLHSLWNQSNANVALGAAGL